VRQPAVGADAPARDRILDAALAVLARDGIAGVTIRAIAREAGVAVGLANYHFENKTALVGAALERIGEKDLELLEPTAAGELAGGATTAAEQLRHCLRRALDPEFLDPAYLSLRLQLWSLAGVDPAYAAVNQVAQRRYLDGLAGLLRAARPDLPAAEAHSRAADILVTQNGVWLTAILIEDSDAVERALALCHDLAFG
jgi:AcrR family transcriptional regulator